jgi:hypothetical protein
MEIVLQSGTPIVLYTRYVAMSLMMGELLKKSSK